MDDVTLGNGHLTNPIGLITADEVVMAGYSPAVDSTTSNYLDIQASFLTASPSVFDSGGANVFNVINSDLGCVYISIDGYGTRPVINLKSDVLFTVDEDGTYVINTN